MRDLHVVDLHWPALPEAAAVGRSALRVPPGECAETSEDPTMRRARRIPLEPGGSRRCSRADTLPTSRAPSAPRRPGARCPDNFGREYDRRRGRGRCHGSPTTTSSELEHDRSRGDREAHENVHRLEHVRRFAAGRCAISCVRARRTTFGPPRENSGAVFGPLARRCGFAAFRLRAVPPRRRRERDPCRELERKGARETARPRRRAARPGIPRR